MYKCLSLIINHSLHRLYIEAAVDSNPPPSRGNDKIKKRLSIH